MICLICYFRNIHPSKKAVILWSLAAYFPYAMISISYFVINTVYDQPYSLLVELCSKEEPRELKPARILVLTAPNLLNVASLIIDILLIKFLHKKIMPQQKSEINMTEQNAIRNETNQGSLNCTEQHGESSGGINLISNSDLQTPPSNQTCSCWIKNWISAFNIRGPERVPIRVSILSSTLIIPYIAVQTVCKSLGLTQNQRTVISWIGLSTANMLRCPMTVILAFKSNAKLAASRKKEIQDEIIGGVPLEANKKYEFNSDSETF